MSQRRCVFSIPATEPFLERFADALLSGELVENFPATNDPLSLARAAIYLPTRRAARALSDIFCDRNIVLQPQLRALGEFEDIESSFAEAEDIEAGGLPAAISPLERQVILTRLILEWLKTEQAADKISLTPSSPADAVYLASELMRLLDMLTYEGHDIAALQATLPLDLQQHWQRAYEFLKVAGTLWPDYLKAAKQMEPALRRSLAMQREAERLSAEPDRPVIAAGSTGSVPVTAEFLAAIAKHPCGAVVLPGLDRDLDEKSWQIVGKGQEPGHPQVSLAALLYKFKLVRQDIVFLESGKNLRARELLASEIMRPAATSEIWADKILPEKDLQAAIENVSLVEAAHEHEEALTIACIMRETLERENATAALVTPDRQLARLVAAEMKRFNLQVDDSAGTPLNVTQAGIFARLVADAAYDICESAATLSLLRHPLCALGQNAGERESANGVIERVLFRGFAGEKNLEAMLRRFGTEPESESARTVDAASLASGKARMLRLHEALKHFAGILNDPEEKPLAVFLQAHRQVLLLCAASENAESDLSGSEEGRALLDFVNELEKAGGGFLAIAGADYSSIFNRFAAQIPVRAVQTEPRLHIYGLLEARLIRHDRLILGGLNEGVWPKAGQADAWLSRGARSALQLPSPERRIGLAAHDFAQGLGAGEVWLTRAKKAGGDPTVPSRFVQRLAAVVGESRFNDMRMRGEAMLGLARRLDEAAIVQSISRPTPNPPFKARPRRLSVTGIEELLRDPYAIYAKHILQLRPFEPLDAAFDRRQRGLVTHAALSEFARAVNSGESPEAEVLERIARTHFEPYFGDAEVKSYWWPRFCALVPALAAFEAERREKSTAVATEVPGVLKFTAAGGEFDLTARADRIETKNGAFAIVDFKTGRLPALKRINQSYALQLTLQAAMLKAGAFGKFSGDSDELIYVGVNDPKELKIQALPMEGIMAFAERTLSAVRRVIDQFDNGAPYQSRADSTVAASYKDYHHLARLREWGIAGEEESAS